MLLFIHLLFTPIRLGHSIAFLLLNIYTEPKPASKGYHVKTTFTYRSYIIQDGNKPRLIYVTDDHNGPILILAGKRELEILHEDVPIGWVTPDKKELLQLAN